MTAAETEARRRFCAKPLRKGKWTETEQRFSEKLIECFLAGVVQDCTDGTTLRAFLSRKLHCAPMRITKKFAGATLGKMIFYRAGFLDPRQLRELESFEAIFLGFEDAQDNDGSDGDGDADDAGETGDASPRKRPLRNRAAAKEDKEESVSSSPRAKAARPLVGGRGSPESSASESGDEDCSVRGDDEDFSDVDAAAETDAVSVAPKRSEPAIFKNAMYAQHQHQHVFARGAPHRPEGALKWAARVAETAAAVTAARRSSELEVVRGLHAAHARQTAETARGDDDACAAQTGAPRQPACAPAAPAAPAAAARGWHSKWQPGAAGVQRASFEDDAPRPSLAEKQQQKLRRDSVVRAAFGASKAAAQLSGQVARTDDGRLDVLRRILDDIDRALPSDSAAEPAPRPDDATTLQVLDDNDPRRRTIADLAVDVICAARAAAADANLDVRDEPASGRAPEVGSRGLSDGVAELIGLLYRKLVVGAAPRVRWQRALPGAGRSRLVLPQSSASSVRSDTDSTRVSFEESDTARPRAQWTGSLFTADAAQRFAVDDHAVRHMARADRPSMNVLADRPRNAPQMSAARSASVLVKGAASVPTNGADARTAVDDDEPMDDAADSRAKAAAAWRGVTELSAQLQAQPRAPPAFSAPPAFAVPPAFAAAPAFAAQAYASAPPPLAHSGVDPRARAHAAGPHAVDWARLAYEQAHHAPQPHWLFDASLHAARDLALTMQLRRAPAMTHAQLQATRPQGFVGRAAHFSVAHALAPPAGYYLPPGQWHAGPAHHAALQQPVARIEDGARGAFLR